MLKNVLIATVLVTASSVGLLGQASAACSGLVDTHCTCSGTLFCPDGEKCSVYAAYACIVGDGTIQLPPGVLP